MNAAKCNDLDSIHFLIAAQKAFTCTQAERCPPIPLPTMPSPACSKDSP